MGSSSSKGEQLYLRQDRGQRRQYRLPHVRAKDRFDQVSSGLGSTSQQQPPSNTSTSAKKSGSAADGPDGPPTATTANLSAASSYEASIDKFDYLIVFPLTEGPYLDPMRFESGDEAPRVSWKKVVEIWKKAAPGTDEEKESAVGELSRIWKLRTGSEPKEHDAVRMNAWLTIARETIIEQLTNRCGLQLKLSANSSHIFCRLRAPIKLLELQTDKYNYPLQFKGEIDPGSEEFWNVEMNGVAVEIEEEKKLYKIEEAKLILEKLYRAGKISPNELLINPDMENIQSLSRRVHALERIADKVPVSNKFIAYFNFPSTKPHLRYLFQTYPSVRGHTLFRSKDRLLLTKAIIDNVFDIEKLVADRVVVSIMALHDANRGEKLTVDSLCKRWVFFWLVSAKDAGCPTITSYAYDEHEEVAWYLRPFSQPLAEIREYFGEKVAMYFAWFGHFSYFLFVPALLGLAIEVVFAARGYVTTVDHLDWPVYMYEIAMITWAAAYQRCWVRECKAVALKWGTDGFESEEKDRPQFHGDPARSRINNRTETYFPEEKRKVIAFFSYLSIILIISTVLCAQGVVIYFEYLMIEKDSAFFDQKWFYWAMSLIIAAIIQVSSLSYTVIAKQMNSNENYRTETEFEDNLVTKTIVFEIFNCFGLCFFTAFFKEWLFGTCYEDSCVADLRILLYAIIIVRVLKTSLLLLLTYIREVWRRSNREKNETSKESASGNPMLSPTTGAEEMQSLTYDAEDDLQFTAEIYREPYRGTFHDFADAYNQFSYICLFSVVMPLLAIISLGENLLKVRLDAYKLCALSRRPHVEQAEDAGYWTEITQVMQFMGIYMSVAIFTIAESSLDQYSTLLRVILFLTCSQLLVFFSMWVEAQFADIPQNIREVVARNKYVVEKFAKEFEDRDADTAGELTQLKGHLDDTIDVDALNLYDLRKGLTISEETYGQMEKLEGGRRELLRELKMVKEGLQEIYKTERFNETTGVGETKHGLSLGRLNMNLIEIQGLLDDEIAGLGLQATFKIRANILGRIGAPNPVPNLAALRDTKVFSVFLDGKVAINQSLGPFAPVKTIHADIVFDILNMTPVGQEKPTEAIVASASLSLRDLEDQAQHDKILPIKVRQANGELRLSKSARLYVNLTFQYSKILPVRRKIQLLQDRLQTIEKELAKLKAGSGGK